MTVVAVVSDSFESVTDNCHFVVILSSEDWADVNPRDAVADPNATLWHVTATSAAVAT